MCILQVHSTRIRTVVAPALSVVECGVGGGLFVWLFVCGVVLVVLLCVTCFSCYITYIYTPAHVFFSFFFLQAPFLHIYAYALHIYTPVCV